MTELGRLLQEARTAKKLSLADVESVTRIRQKYLEALESGDHSKLPRGAVARGLLRLYAAYLGLDVPAVLNLYGQESGDAGGAVPIAEPGKPRLVDYRPIEVELIDPVPATRWWPWIVALLLVAALAAGGWYMLNRNPGWNPLAALMPPPTATATRAFTVTPWIVTATPLPASPTPASVAASQTSEPGPGALPTSELLPLPTPTVPASPTPTPRPTATPEVVAQIALDLRATQRAWVRVVVDGQPAEEGTLEPGDTRAWDADQSVTVRTGNAGGVALTLNGEDLGPMGEPNQVVERTWVVDDAGVSEATAGTGTPAPTLSPTPAG